MSDTADAGGPRSGARARIEHAALDLFTRRGFDGVTIDEIADAAGIGRRTYFRYFATKADAVWGDFQAHVVRLAGLLEATDSTRPVLASISSAYVEVNDYSTAELPMLRHRMRLILTEPALQAHSQLRYAEIDRVVAAYVARRTGQARDGLLPRLVATSSRAAATTAFEVWLGDDEVTLGGALRAAFTELFSGFGALRAALREPA